MKNNLLGKKNCLKVLRLVLRLQQDLPFLQLQQEERCMMAMKGWSIQQEVETGFTETPNQAPGLNGVNPSNNGYGHVKKDENSNN